MDELRIGMIVFFKITANIVRPAMVVDILPSGRAQLQVFVDGLNDRSITAGPNDEECLRGMMWRMSVGNGDGVGQFTTEQPQPESITGAEPGPLDLDAVEPVDDAAPVDDQDGSELVKEPKPEPPKDINEYPPHEPAGA